MKQPTPTALQSFVITPIGEVQSFFQTPSERYNYEAEVQIVVRQEYSEALTGVEYFSHLWVIYRQHRSEEWLKAQGWGPRPPLVVPMEDERAGQGIFSTRAPCRPALLGSCIVQLIRREENLLVVRGLDALSGTPVLDLKPYVPHFDAFPQAQTPLHWSRVMDRPEDAVRLSREFHWDNTNADFMLGVRAGFAALKHLGLGRGALQLAEIQAPAVFAQGFEMSTGCSPLRGSLLRSAAADGTWCFRVQIQDTSFRARVLTKPSLGAFEIAQAAEEALFQWESPNKATAQTHAKD